MNTYQIAQTDEQHNGRRPAKHGDRPAEIRPTEQRDDGAGQHDESHHKRQRQAEHKPYTLVRHGRKSVHLAERQQIGTPRQHHHAQRSDHRQHDLGQTHARRVQPHGLVALHESQHHGVQIHVDTDNQVQDKNTERRTQVAHDFEAAPVDRAQ